MDGLRVAAIMPCLGRERETVESITRLRATAGYEDWELLIVVDGDKSLHDVIGGMLIPASIGYWGCLSVASKETDAPLLVNLANDLLPGRSWLGRAVNAYRSRFADGQGVMGFNDGIHAGATAAHFLVSRSILHHWYGDDYWPLAYHHNFGDTEICERAKSEKLFAVAPFAVLYHNHPVTGGKSDDVYSKGLSTWQADQQTFEKRKRLWQ